MQAPAALGDPEDEGRRLVGAGDEGEGVLETSPVFTAIDPFEVGRSEPAEFPVDAVEVASVGQFPQDGPSDDEDGGREQAGEERELEPEGVRPHLLETEGVTNR